MQTSNVFVIDIDEWFSLGHHRSEGKVVAVDDDFDRLIVGGGIGWDPANQIHTITIEIQRQLAVFVEDDQPAADRYQRSAGD